MCGGGSTATLGRVATGITTGGLSEVARGVAPGVFGGGPSAPNAPVYGAPPPAPTLPALSDLSSAEKAILDKKGISADFLNTLLKNQSNPQAAAVLNGLSGLYSQDGSVDQNALASLTQKVNARVGIGDQAVQKLGGILDQAPTAFDNFNQRIQSEEQQRYSDALQGKTAQSASFVNDKQKAFDLLKEAAARRGIKIEGDSPDQAVSQGTAGNQILAEFNKRYDALAEQQRQADLSQLGQANLSRTQLNQGASGQQFNQLASLVQDPNLSYAAKLNFLNGSAGFNQQQLQNQLGIAGTYNDILNQNFGVYAGQRTAQDSRNQQQTLLNYDNAQQGYNVQNQNAQAAYQSAYNAYLQKQQNQNALFGGIGSIVGTGVGAYFGGPMGAKVGNSVGSGIAGDFTAQPYNPTLPYNGQSGNKLSLY